MARESALNVGLDELDQASAIASEREHFGHRMSRRAVRYKALTAGRAAFSLAAHHFQVVFANEQMIVGR